MRYILSLLATCFCLVAGAAYGAHTQVQLLLSANPVRPGDTVWAGVDMKMDPGWHTYWKNPGDSGIATQIKWLLPPGVNAGDIQWPLPKKASALSDSLFSIRANVTCPYQTPRHRAGVLATLEAVRATASQAALLLGLPAVTTTDLA